MPKIVMLAAADLPGNPAMLRAGHLPRDARMMRDIFNLESVGNR